MVKHGIPNGLPTRLVYRSLYVCFTTFIAVTIPFFGDLMVRGKKRKRENEIYFQKGPAQA